MPWDPSERNQVGHLLMQGMSGMGDRLGSGLVGYGQNKRALEIMAEERKEKAKDEKDMGKASETAFRIMAKGSPDLGITEEEFGNMSAREKTAIVTGIMKAQGAQEVMQRIKLNQAKIDEMKKGPAPIPAGFEPQSIMRDGIRYGKPEIKDPIPSGFEPQSIMRDGVKYGKPEAPSPWDQLKPGQKVSVDGVDYVATNPKQITRKGEAPKTPVKVPNDPSITGDDDAAFTKFVGTLEDEDQRKRAMEQRKLFKSLTKEDNIDPEKLALISLLNPSFAEKLMEGKSKDKAVVPSKGGAQFKFNPNTSGIDPVK